MADATLNWSQRGRTQWQCTAQKLQVALLDCCARTPPQLRAHSALAAEAQHKTSRGRWRPAVLYAPRALLCPFAALGRYAREWFLQGDSDTTVRSLLLSVRTLAVAFDGAQRLYASSTKWRQFAHDPIALAISAAKVVEWEFISAATIRRGGDTGQVIDLRAGSPAMLRDIYHEDAEWTRMMAGVRRVYCRLLQSYRSMNSWTQLAEKGIWIELTRRVLFSQISSRLSSLAKTHSSTS